MDPNANLDEQILLAARIQQLAETAGRRALTLPEQMEFTESAERLAELVEALDGWIVHGAALPNRWQIITVRTSAH